MLYLHNRIFPKIPIILAENNHRRKSPPLVMREGLGVGVWGYLTSTTRYLLVDQKSCGLVMRSTYCLLTSGVRV